MEPSLYLQLLRLGVVRILNPNPQAEDQNGQVLKIPPENMVILDIASDHKFLPADDFKMPSFIKRICTPV